MSGQNERRSIGNPVDDREPCIDGRAVSRVDAAVDCRREYEGGSARKTGVERCDLRIGWVVARAS